MADILVAEQVPDIQNVLIRILQRAGHHVRSSNDGRNALEQARDNPPDLLVMNPDLPGLNGLDVCRQLRTAAATAALPILMLSVHQYPAEQEAARRAGADDYLGKPFLPGDLLARVEALLTGAEPASAR